MFSSFWGCLHALAQGPFLCGQSSIFQSPCDLGFDASLPALVLPRPVWFPGAQPGNPGSLAPSHPQSSFCPVRKHPHRLQDEGVNIFEGSLSTCQHISPGSERWKKTREVRGVCTVSGNPASLEVGGGSGEEGRCVQDSEGACPRVRLWFVCVFSPVSTVL